MSLVTIPHRYAVRGGTSANLAAVNEVPLSRELVFETDTGKFKLGDGVTRYNDLPYTGLDLEQIDDRVAALLVSGTGISLTYDDTAGTLTIDASGGGGGTSSALAVSIFQKLQAGDWFDMEEAASGVSTLAGKRNGTIATKVGTGATTSGTAKLGSKALDISPSAVFHVTNTGLPFAPAAVGVLSAAGWVDARSIANVCPFSFGANNTFTGALKNLMVFLLSTGAVVARAGNGSSFFDASAPAGSIATGSYYFVQAERGRNYVRVRVNAGSWVSAAVPVDTIQTGSTQGFMFGGDLNGASIQNAYDGAMDAVIMGNFRLTDAEWNYLYNSGTGKSYADLLTDAGLV